MGEFLQRYGMVLLPPAIGFVGLYLLLPQVRRSRPALGAALGGVALILAGWFIVHNEAALPETILFYAFSGTAIVGGTLMLAQRNPVHAALSFALVVLSTCGLFLLLAAPFLMAATIIVYAGAIIVTFLFVIMLAQQSGLGSAEQRSREPFLASLAGFILMGALLCVLERTYDTRTLDNLLARVEQVAQAKSEDDIKAVLGDPASRPVGAKSLPLVEELRKALRGFDHAKLDNIHTLASPLQKEKLQALFTEIHDYAQRVRSQFGALQPAADLPLSPFSGTPPNQAPERRTLPARNVAGLGRTLFTDYLLGVELAGTLLLVASIGAIAIAGRRSEALR